MSQSNHDSLSSYVGKMVTLCSQFGFMYKEAVARCAVGGFYLPCNHCETPALPVTNITKEVTCMYAFLEFRVVRN